MVCIKVKKLSRMIRNMSLFLVLAMFFLSAPVLSAEETISEASTGILTKLADNDKAKGKIEDINKDIESLKKYATTEGYSEAKSSPGDTKLLDTYQHIQDTIEELYRDKHITLEERNQLKEDASRLYKTAADQVIKTADAGGDTKTRDKVQEEIAAATVEYGIAECPTSGQLRARYHAGCWSCLVLEKLTSAFLHAANHGLKVVQKAGLTLLWLGAAIWIVFWGLKNVSSFTEIQLGNILNDLIKFLFKVAVAYWFIVYSPTAISQYFIKPIMSVGAIIAQQFWDTKVKEYTESWDTMTDEDYERQEKEVKEMPELQETPVPKPDDIPVVSESKMTEEDIKEDDAANSRNEANFAKKKIPNLLIPGTKDGCLTSPFGCRVRPCSKCSKSHKGVDVGVGCTGKNANQVCVPILAAGPGVIEYRRKNGTGDGSGHTAYINHGNIGGHNWKTSYFHMRANIEYFKTGDRVRQGDTIGCIGNTGVGTGPHLHFQVFIDDKVIDPLALPMGHIVYMKDTCDGKTASHYSPTVYQHRKPVGKGFPAAGEAIENLNAAAVSAESGGIGAGAGAGDINYDDLIVEIPEIKYTGPTNIMPKSVMNSILGATRAITDTTADVMVMGDMMMCYASAKNGGAWHVQAWVLDLGYWTNFVMWIQGGIIWCLGFMLTVAIAYYLVDISFKIGFAVLAIPVMMGLWPFGFTQGKIFIAISIIAKSAATFAFLALTTAFGMGLVGEAVGGLEELYGSMDALTQGETEEESIRSRVSDTLYLFSPTFVLLIFAILYFYKMVQQTISDLVNKFFPDQAFGDSSPMHSGATMATSYLKRFAMKASGADLAKDIVAHQTGRLVKGGLKRAGAVASYPIRHPMKSTRAAVHAIAHPVKTGKAVGNATVKGAKAVGNAIRHPVKTGKKALNAAGRGIKKGWNRASGKE